MRSTKVLRWVLVALSALLAVFLIVRGSVVIGVIVGAMAVTRAVFFLRLQHQRDQFHERIIARREAYRRRVANRAQ
jgi:hypothetical protein